MKKPDSNASASTAGQIGSPDAGSNKANETSEPPAPAVKHEIPKPTAPAQLARPAMPVSAQAKTATRPPQRTRPPLVVTKSEFPLPLKQAPDMEVKGAEKLMASNAPAIVHPTEAPPRVAVAQTGKMAPAPAQTSATASPMEFVVKGTPRPVRQSTGTGSVWLMLLFASAAVAAGVFYYRQQFPKKVSAKKAVVSDEIVLPKELAMKEPAGSKQPERWSPGLAE